MSLNPDLPSILAGPIVRAVNRQQCCIWMVTSTQQDIHFSLLDAQQQPIWDNKLGARSLSRVRIGEHAYINLIHIDIELQQGQNYFYDVKIQQGDHWLPLTDLIPDLLYPQQQLPSFSVPGQLQNVLHGSCRKPHHPTEDALVGVDQQLEQAFTGQEPKPDLLLMTGDQVYVDDVAGPMLTAIHQVIDLLGLYQERFDNPVLPDTATLLMEPKGFYLRDLLLPDHDDDSPLYKSFIAGKKKPIFTSVNAKNHLMSLSEVLAMYLLVWSPALWSKVNLDKSDLAPKFQKLYQQEKHCLEVFQESLPTVRRALAHIPTYMIFDDHDVTDDWNLTRAWEEAVYGNPFSKRIIGNALIGYWLCQGWGNQPQIFHDLLHDTDLFEHQRILDQDLLIEKLLHWHQWHYQLDTQPAVVVLDTRTQRWRSESKPHKPSGLMDWESLCDLQQTLIGKESVILVSAAPIYGVKLIEIIQKIFTFFGKALMVDAENWMAHKGTASVMLNIFRHVRTPPNFIILSGDVHYSFVYDVSLKFRSNSPEIMQFTASGIKNTFPGTLLALFDKLNQVFYAKYSPLNWLTQRRYMTVKHRRPRKLPHRSLLNQAGIGQLIMDTNGKPVSTKILSLQKASREFV